MLKKVSISQKDCFNPGQALRSSCDAEDEYEAFAFYVYLRSLRMVTVVPNVSGRRILLMVLDCASENVMIGCEALRLKVEKRVLSLHKVRRSSRLNAQVS